ncbi:phospho-sugar mutase [Siminovitchia sediminis]|uniref:Phosphoglucomutase n=1 Tax=Siminovitchia sediminis TaxID=1274353 RepID=A0ABW4KID2_9BACI
MNWKNKLEHWLTHLPPDDPLRKELENHLNPEECFYKDLKFGTAGMRGILGPGTNCMNVYTIRKAVAGLAELLTEKGEEAMGKGVVIAHDCRHMSAEFALESARILGMYGIRSYLFKELRPTPLLSFAVRYLGTSAGIMITASHNPPQYNGLKVYGEDGAQLLPEAAGHIVREMDQMESELYFDPPTEKELLQRGLLTYIGKQIDNAYLNALASTRLQKGQKDVTIVFTPLHGTAAPLVRKGLTEAGFFNLTLVKEQMHPDPDFSTVSSPNPEEHDAFKLAIQYGEKVDADLLLATDPDADRLGVAVKNDEGQYTVLTGNQVGALMLDYLLKQSPFVNKGAMIQTIVTSDFGRAIAADFGVETFETLTGFKYIAEKIAHFERTAEYQFLFGYEESYGYLIRDFVRDKDAVQAAIFIAEVAAFFKRQGKSLYEALMGLFEEYGYYQESLTSIQLEGQEGAEQIRRIMDTFRQALPAHMGVVMVEDYLKGESLHLPSGEKTAIQLPKENVLKFKLADKSWFCIRPSGTEPKCKFYFGVKGGSMEESVEKLRALEAAVFRAVPVTPRNSSDFVECFR